MTVSSKESWKPGWRPPVDGRLQDANDRAAGRRQRDGEFLLTRERAGVSQSMGLRALRRNDTAGRSRDMRLANGHLARDIDDLMTWAYAQQADSS